MAINKPSIATSDNNETMQALRLEVLGGPPPNVGASSIIDPPVTPNRLYGWYNGNTDMVELYITASSGTRYMRCSTFAYDEAQTFLEP